MKPIAPRDRTPLDARPPVVPPRVTGPVPSRLREVRNASSERPPCANDSRRRPSAWPVDDGTCAKRAAYPPRREAAALSATYSMRELEARIRAHRQAPCELDVLTAGTRLLKAASDAREARRLYGHLAAKLESVGLHPNERHLTTVIHACVAERDMDAAMAMFRQSQANPRIAPDAAVFNLLLGGYVAKGDRKGIAHVLALMEAQVPPVARDRHTYIQLLMDAKERGDGEAAHALLREMTSRAKAAPDLRPGLDEWTAAVRAYARGAALERDEGLEPGRHLQCERMILLMQLEDPPVRPVLWTYRIALWACATAGDWEALQRVRQDMDAQDPPVRLDRSAWEALLFAARTHCDRARALLDAMDHAGIAPGPEGYSLLISAFRNAGRTADAVRLVDHAIRTESFAPSAGYDAPSDELNFHWRSIVGRIPLDLPSDVRAVGVELARTLLEWHLDRGHIRPGSTFIVGKGEGVLRDSVLSHLEAWGWSYGVAPGNAGKLLPLRHN